MNQQRNISGLKFGGTHRQLPNGQIILTTIGERLKARNANKLFENPDKTLGKYKHFKKKDDMSIVKLLTRWQRKYFIRVRKAANKRRQEALAKINKPTDIVKAGGDTIVSRID